MLRPLLLLFWLDILAALTVGMMPPLLPGLVAEWSLSSVDAGLVNTVYAVGRLGSTYPASRIRARWGTRNAVFLGIAILAVGCEVCGLAATFPGFLVGRLLMGLGTSVAFFTIFAEVLEATPAAWRGRIANLFEGLSILSLGLGGALAAAVASRAGWQVVFLVTGPVLALALVAWRPLGPAAGRQASPAGMGGGQATLGTLAANLSVYMAAFTMSVTWSGLFATLAPLLGEAEYRITSAFLGLALGAGYVAELAGLVALGVVIDRVRREPAFLVGALTVALGGVVLAVGAAPVVFVAGLTLVGGGFAVWMIPATVLVDRTGTPVPPAQLALFRIAIDLGMVAGPLTLGFLADVAGHRTGVGMSGIVMLAGALALGRRPGGASHQGGDRPGR